MGKGGVHCRTPYMYSMVRQGGIRAKCNLDLLDSMAFTISGLVGPWILGGDWNCTTEDLAATGWLRKVVGVIHAPIAPTCNGKVYDFFRGAEAIPDQVQSTHVIAAVGFTPHSPSRLIFKGTPAKRCSDTLRPPRAFLPYSRMGRCGSRPRSLMH